MVLYYNFMEFTMLKSFTIQILNSFIVSLLTIFIVGIAKFKDNVKTTRR